MYRAAIADDEIGIREGLRELVDWNSLGFSLEGTFEDGEGLLSLLARNPPDLIVTDIRMNRVSGLDVSRCISENNLPTKVILISGYKEADLAMSAIKYGVKDYILKPVDLDELTSRIKKIRAELDEKTLLSHQESALKQAKNDMRNMMQLLQNAALLYENMGAFPDDCVKTDSPEPKAESTAGNMQPCPESSTGSSAEPPLSGNTEPLPESPVMEVDFALRTREYIQKHIGEDISLEDVAEHFYLSSSYFSRIFKAQTGENFVRFVSRCKMDYAAKLLAETDLKIYDVCERTGYRSLRHFNKLFKAHTGVQPSIYRQRMRMGGNGHEF